MDRLHKINTDADEPILSKLTNDDENSIEAKLIGEEVFLQKIFEQDARRGCEILFKRYYTNLCNHAMRFVYSKEGAEDIVSEIFASFWQNKVYEKINTSYRAYLYKAVRYRSYNYIKSELNQIESLKPNDALSEIPVLQPDELLQFNDLTQKLDRIVQGLPPQCRKAFQLNRLEGKKYAQVAAELNITVSAVERLISRALSKLRTELREDWLVCLFIISLIFT
ncbi:MAG: RNA polymerase sigma-70 factor [Saprospiraceae bacterium]|nr:RNA polymerase sigma-70 factor [Saprospiraceae bacterium]